MQRKNTIYLVIIMVLGAFLLGSCGGANRIPQIFVTITVETIPVEDTGSRQPLYGGLVRIDGGQFGSSKDKTVLAGAVVTIEASAFDDYDFEGWYVGQTRVSTQPVLQITAQTNTTYRANFVPKAVLQYALNLQADPAAGGTVIGSGNYPADQIINIQATANTGYQFVNWTRDGAVISTQAIYNYTMPTQNVTLVANFALVDPSGVYRALSIGVSKDSQGKDDLVNAANDPYRIESVLTNLNEPYTVQKQIGYITKANVITWLNSFIAGSKAEDVFLFHYSGHGYYGNNQSYLDLSSGTISINELRTELSKIQGTKIVFIDACESERFVDLAPDMSFEERMARAEQFNTGVLEAFHEDPMSRGAFLSNYEYYVLTGAAYNESSYEDDKLQSGYMTFFLSDGMGHVGSNNPTGSFNGSYNADGYGSGGVLDRQLTFKEVYHYTHDKVKQYEIEEWGESLQTVQGNHTNDTYVIGTY